MDPQQLEKSSYILGVRFQYGAVLSRKTYWKDTNNKIY
jgi:hypothetical protein